MRVLDGELFVFVTVDIVAAKALHISHTAGECGSARGPKDTFCRSSQGVSPCEGNSKDDRIGVQVESVVVLKCEGNNNEGACDMLC